MRLSKLLVRKLRTAATLPVGRFRCIAHAWYTLTVVQCALDVLPYRYWEKPLNSAMNSDPDGDGSAGAASHQACNEIAQDIAIAARNHFLKVNCLGRSLALHRLCRRAGFSTQIAIGIRKNRGNIEGHAWLEAGGVVVNDTLECISAFTKLDRVPSLRPAFVT